MGLFGGNNRDAQERYYNAPVSQVYAAMKRMLENSNDFKLQSSDDVSCSCSFKSGISMTTWGEKLTASVVPSGEGSKVEVSIAANVSGGVFQGKKNSQHFDNFFGALSSELSRG